MPSYLISTSFPFCLSIKTHTILLFFSLQVCGGQKVGLETFFYGMDGQGQVRCYTTTSTKCSSHGPQGTKIGPTLHRCRHGRSGIIKLHCLGTQKRPKPSCCRVRMGRRIQPLPRAMWNIRDSSQRSWIPFNIKVRMGPTCACLFHAGV